MKRLIILDFDHTAFNTDKFMRELAIAADNNWLESRIMRLKRPRGSAAWFAALLWLVQKIGRAKLPADNRYVCADVADFLEAAKQRGDEVVILTTGFKPWQTFKRDISSVLQAVPFKVVPRNKGHFLRNHIRAQDDGLQVTGLSRDTYDEIMLIDDLPDTFSVLMDDSYAIPEQFKLVRLRRKGDRYSEQNAPVGVSEITSLDHIQ